MQLGSSREVPLQTVVYLTFPETKDKTLEDLAFSKISPHRPQTRYPITKSLTRTVFEGEDKAAEQTKRSTLHLEEIEISAITFPKKV